MEHKVDNWAVIVGQWRAEVGQITKVSPKQIRTRRNGNPDREAYHLVSEVVFSGTKQQADDLRSVLIGLDARKHQAALQLDEQHRERVQAAILSARASA